MRTPFESERLALLSRITQAKRSIERVMDLLDGTFDPALSLALDRLVELREHAESKEYNLPPLSGMPFPRSNLAQVERIGG